MRDTAGEGAAPRGHLRISAPLLFGRRHLTPIVNGYLACYPDASVELSLNDRPVDLIEEGIDVALRIARLDDSSLVARRIGMVRRVVVASPAYLARHGTPATPDDIGAHQVTLFVNHANSADWRFADRTVRVKGASRPIAPRPRSRPRATGTVFSGYFPIRSRPDWPTAR